MLSLFCQEKGLISFLIDKAQLIKKTKLTLRVDTRSAVSSSVSWLIWSTMLSILGFAAATASVELYRLDVVETRMRRADALAEGVDRSWRAQACAAYRQDMAIVVGGDASN